MQFAYGLAFSRFLFLGTFLDDRVTDAPGGYKRKLNIQAPLVKTWSYSGRYGRNNKIGDRTRSCWKSHMRNNGGRCSLGDLGMPRRTHCAWEPLISRTASCKSSRATGPSWPIHVDQGRKTREVASHHNGWPHRPAAACCGLGLSISPKQAGERCACISRLICLSLCGTDFFWLF